MVATASVLLAGVLWGIISIFVKTLSAAGMSSLQISAVRMLVAAVSFTAALAVFSPAKLKIRPRDVWLFVGTGIVSVVMFNTLYFYAMVESQASVAVVLLYTSPVFVMLLSAALFKERVTPRKVGALALTLGGCVLVTGLMGGGQRITPMALLAGLGSGFFYSLYTIFGRAALAKYDTLTVTAYTFIFGAIGAVPLGSAGETLRIVASQPGIIWYCLGIGVICTVLPYFFYTFGLQRMESGRAAILVAVEPLVGAVVGMTLYGEPHDAARVAGVLLILAAMALLNVTGRKKNAIAKRADV